MPENTKTALIIGSGIAGIGVAIRLALKGYDVKVYEAAPQPGGKLSELAFDGLRFDTGPSLFTMPQYVDELFRLAGKDPLEHFKYHRLETTCKYFFEDGTRINAFADLEKFAQEIEEKTTDTASSVQVFFDKSRVIYQITNPVFLQRTLHRVSSYFNLTTLRSLLNFWKIDPFRTMNQANSTRFTDPKTVRLFNRYATYNGSNPYRAPATLNVIPYFEHHFGAYFPEGGMFAIVTALVALAESCGVIFQYNSYVDKIEMSRGKVIGLTTAGQFHPAELVVSNMDIWYTYRRLLKHLPAPEKALKQERSSSAVIFYWGINRQFSELGLHNIFFSDDYEREFDHIWKEKDIASDPTVYVNITSKQKGDDAPVGSENWFTMINVPSDSGQDWDALIERARANILRKLSDILGVDLSRSITSERIMDPRDIDSKTFSYQGALYGSSSNNQFAAFLRHSNFSSKIKGLYFAGGSVHPGGGIPLALLSAKIVSNLIR